ncbi:hypothetical protein V6N12_074843 [Hibiscus sabdariffa]|uniref:RNase H type-1 domain-containing protein n=1 Tax=Hibiscus sabdariffa TaxID=183260 RepID=A0ABR2D2J3_9ROSI
MVSGAPIMLLFALKSNDTPLSHLFFIDDLILYARVDMGQAKVMESILSKFAAPNALEAQTIIDLVSSDGIWSLPTLQLCFIETAIAHIIGIRCPNPLVGNDRCVWRWTPRAILNSSRLICASPTCPLCSNLPETILQTMRDCDESDCHQAIDLICYAEANSSAHSLVRAITRLRQLNWEVVFIWTPREANRAGDSMAKLANPYVFSLSIFLVAPLEMAKFIEIDKLYL